MTRNALRDHEGREVKHLGDGIMSSFCIGLDQSIAVYEDAWRKA